MTGRHLGTIATTVSGVAIAFSLSAIGRTSGWSVEFGNLATWLGAIGTIAAVSVALYKAGDDGRHRSRAAHQEQAKSVTAWWHGTEQGRGELVDIVGLVNSSPNAAYRVAVFVVLVQGGGYRTGEQLMDSQAAEHLPSGAAFLSVLPPGRWSIDIPSGGGGMSMHFGVEIAFTDCNNSHWIRRSNGKLEEIDDDPYGHYRVPLPLGYSNGRLRQTHVD